MPAEAESGREALVAVEDIERHGEWRLVPAREGAWRVAERARGD